MNSPRLLRGNLTQEPLEERLLLSSIPWSQFAGDAQHTATSLVAAQPLEAIHWKASVDSDPGYTNESLFVHYGSPLVTAGNTVVVSELYRPTGGFQVSAIDGATGAVRWTQNEGIEYVAPNHTLIPSYSPGIADLPSGPRLYFPGADGTLFYRDNVDSPGAVAAGRIAFYGDALYAAQPSAFDDVRVSSPIVSDSSGNVFFTYRASGTNPLGLIGGVVRINASGAATYLDIGTPALDSAPALSQDGTKLYSVISGYLVRFDSTTLARLSLVRLGTVPVSSSASPTIGPDGDVYFGVTSPSVHGRGSLSHFSADLSVTYTPGSFGWDDTVSIVPASMVPSYTGTSSYLLMAKYNDYIEAGGSGVNKLALLDPKATQIDAVTGQLAMATVLSIAAPTPDDEFPDHPGAVVEWCINSAAVDPATHSIFANNEDGYLYRWDTVTNTLAERIQLTSGIGEAYTPTAIGADGTVYAINNAVLFAIGRQSNVTGRYLFYDNSAFDGHVPGPSGADEQAIATDKQAYLPGTGGSTFASVSSYTSGLNGIAVDLEGWHGAISLSDFEFRVGNNNSPSTWSAAPSPTQLAVLPGAGVSGSDRIELTWADGAIRNQWLEVTVRGNDTAGGFNLSTGLPASDVFYFGSVVGDTGLGDMLAYSVSATDEIATLNHPTGLANPATISNPYDFNRDGKVNVTDVLIARNNATTAATELCFLDLVIDAPAADEANIAAIALSLARKQDNVAESVPAELRAVSSYSLVPEEPPGDVDDGWWVTEERALEKIGRPPRRPASLASSGE